jgi:hypothetical protein
MQSLIWGSIAMALGCGDDAATDAGGRDARVVRDGGGLPRDASDPPPGRCGMSTERLRVTEVDVGMRVNNDEDEAALTPIAISPVPSGGSRMAFMSDDDRVHVVALDADDRATGAPVALPAHDFAALHADDAGGVVLLTRAAEGGGTLGCGAPANLCGTPPSPPIPCFDMYLVRFDGEAETWATKLTSSSAELPPYSTGPDGPNVFMIWWYAHHGRIAFDGTNYAAYFGAAISVSQGGCINIHQGDRMKVVAPNGALASGGFDWGCSHSGYERIVWDDSAGEFVTVCKTDNENRLAFAPDYRTIRPVDLAYSNFGDVVTAPDGYWLVTSDIRDGEPAGMDGLAEVLLLHSGGALADREIVVAGDPGVNHRAPHLATYGNSRLVVAWESTSRAGDIERGDPERTLHLQTRDRDTGEAEGDAIDAGVRGNRYHELVSFPDGSVAFVAPGASPTSIAVLRVLPCAG